MSEPGETRVAYWSVISPLTMVIVDEPSAVIGSGGALRTIVPDGVPGTKLTCLLPEAVPAEALTVATPGPSVAFSFTLNLPATVEH